MSGPVIRFRGFTFRYKSQKAPTLKCIDLEVDRGEKILVVGPSGSGKSTLGSCINGLIPFSYEGDLDGSLEVAGLETRERSLHELGRIVGTVLQDTDGQFVGLSVGEDIAFALENAAVPQTEMVAVVARSAGLVGMADFTDRSPFELSGGQKQRVSLAGIMVDDVDLLLFDEPLANLDPATGKVAIELIDEIHRSTGKTVIIIEHRLEDVLHRPVDRILLMEKGRIIADQEPHRLLASPLILEKGLREPLYITAMKYAGCSLEEADRAAYIDTLELEGHRERLLDWFDARVIPPPGERGPSLLRAEDLNFSYDGERTALENISFDVTEGEMIALLGKNGAGKSTFASLVMGLLKPDTGALFFRGSNMSAMNIAERSGSIGYVMQNPNHMISHHMVREEVGFGPRLKGLPEEEIEQRVDAVLKLCGLYPFRNWPIPALSYGQRKRVTIASILIMEPRLLILDEPTAGQDYRHYSEIMDFLADLNRRTGLTLIFITHDMHLALEYTPRAVVLTDGQMLRDDTTARIFSDPDLIEQANLKLTSLYTLANRLEIGSPEEFIGCFIEEERKRRVWISQR
jgi:energy-coupling factor transport system ATP-binding protein